MCVINGPSQWCAYSFCVLAEVRAYRVAEAEEKESVLLMTGLTSRWHEELVAHSHRRTNLPAIIMIHSHIYQQSYFSIHLQITSIYSESYLPSKKSQGGVPSSRP
jgi:hypothetical protein